MSEQKNFCEYIYKTPATVRKTVGKVMLINMYALFTLLYLFLFWYMITSIALLVLLPFIMFAMIRVTWRLVQTEYEISVEAGELKIAVIYGKSGRKTRFRYDVREMSLIVPYDDAHADLVCGGDVTETKLFLGDTEDSVAYACVCPDKKKSAKTAIVFMCTDEMKKLLRISNPSAFRQ